MNSRFRRFLSAAVALAVLPAMAAAQDGATVTGRVTSDAGAPLASAAATPAASRRSGIRVNFRSPDG